MPPYSGIGAKFMNEALPESMRMPDAYRKLEIYPGYACSRSCRFCFVSRDDRIRFAAHIPFRKLCETVYKAYIRGSRSLSVLGGEPTLYPHLLELLAFAKKTGYSSAVLFSNGFRLSDKDYVGKLAETGLKAVHFNLPSCESDAFDYLTRSKDGLQKAVMALDNLAELKIPVIAVCVINKSNYNKLPGYADFYMRHGVSAFMLHYTKLAGCLDPDIPENKENLEIVIPASKAAEGIRQMTDFCVSKQFVPPFVDIMQPCLLGRYATRLIDFTQFHNDPESELMIQPDIDMSETWDLSYKGRGKPPSCARCIWKDKCYGIDGNYIKMFGTDEFVPVISDPGAYYEGLPENFVKKLLKPLPELVEERYRELNGNE